MKLKDYLSEQEISVSEFSKSVNLSRQIVHGYLNGKLPTIPTAKRIEEITDGKVHLYSWADDANPRPTRGKTEEPQTVDDSVEGFW